MIVPRFIRKGDTIGVTAPSAGITEGTDINRFAEAKRWWEERGYHVVETPNVYECVDGRSCSAERRARELNSLFRNDDVSVVYAASGGDYECEILPYMDWRAAEGHAKWIQGYSDNTTLLFKLTAEHDVATVYAGNFGDFGMVPLHKSVEEGVEFLEGVRSSQHSFPYHSAGFRERVIGLEPFDESAETEWTSSVGDTEFAGRPIGGCMDVIEWFVRERTADASGFVSKYREDGVVWYLETFDMDERRVRDTLNAMTTRGWMRGCSAVIFGRPLFYSGAEYRRVAEDALSALSVPVITGADVGHVPPRMTFLNGVPAEFDIRGGRCGIAYDFQAAIDGGYFDNEPYISSENIPR